MCFWVPYPNYPMSSLSLFQCAVHCEFSAKVLGQDKFVGFHWIDKSKECSCGLLDLTLPFDENYLQKKTFYFRPEVHCKKQA